MSNLQTNAELLDTLPTDSRLTGINAIVTGYVEAMTQAHEKPNIHPFA